MALGRQLWDASFITVPTLVLASERAEPEVDLDHLRASMDRSPADRLALAISWNQFAGEIAEAGRTATARK